MTRDEAIEQLTSNASHMRLKAARFLSHNSDPADVQILRKALQIETVSYIRTCLNLAVKRIETFPAASEGGNSIEFEVPTELRTQIKNEVTEELTGLILHEIASPVGLLASSVEREIASFENSDSKKHLINLRQVFEAIEQLKGAASIPKPQEFDLETIILTILDSIDFNPSIEISLHGPKPFLIVSDQALLSFALSNGIRNAVESVEMAEIKEPHPVIINWGVTDVDYWVAVIDRGIGIVGPVESAFGIGQTTKRSHSGFGLTIARQAIESLGGTCTLQPIVEGGAHFELRWEK